MGPSSKISKILLTLLVLLVVFYIAMDVQLYLRIRNYPVERDYHFNSTATAGAGAAASVTTYSAAVAGHRSETPHSMHTLTSEKTGVGVGVVDAPTMAASAPHSSDYNTWLPCNVNPLCDVTVKALLLDHTNHYVFAPLAIMFDNVVGISRSTFVTANMVSFSHVGVACVAGKLVASDSIGYRRLGVVLFQVRTFLDDLDGHVARTKKNIRGERSEVGTTGYYVDGICDALGCVALIIGMFFYLKGNRPRRGYTQLPMVDTKSGCGIGGGGGSGGGGGCTDNSLALPKIKASTRDIAKKTLCFTGQLLISSTAWNRYIAIYQEMLESNDVTRTQFARQNVVFKSSRFFAVCWLWRLVNVHSLLHLVLLSIFCDKLWDFLKVVQYIGFIVLLAVIGISEMHIREVANYINVGRGNNSNNNMTL